MKLKVNKISQIKHFGIVSLILVILLTGVLVGVTNSIKAQKDKSLVEKTHSNLKNDEEVTKLLKNLREKDRSKKVKVDAIQRLGVLVAKEAVPDLISYIDYGRETNRLSTEPLNKNSNFIVDEYEKTNWQDPAPISWQYPAAEALIKIGEPSLPYLIKVIESENLDSIKSQNAIYVIQQIFLEDLSKAIVLLEKTSIESRFPNGGDRLLVAARKTKEIWEKLQNYEK